MPFRTRVFVGTAVIAAGCLVGCFGRQTRLPTICSGDRLMEQRDLERHDPFPSRTAGPVTFTRPRGYVEERTDVRQSKEQALLRGMNRGPNIPPPYPSSGNEAYPGSVRE